MDKSFDKKQWLKKYRDTSELLQTIRERELRAMTDEEALRQIQSLCVAGKPWRQRPDWSGLVEQQAIFHRRRKS
jgi:hypothetical protein